MSGIDYYASDTGGFHREALDGDLNELYTQWLGNASLFDVPIKPHTENLCRCKETAPDRVGDLDANLANVRLRYELVPYLYSLAHRAYRFGEPLIAPMVYFFESDPNVRSMGHEKMIGPSLLAAIVARHGETSRDVYLPAGKWFDFRTGEAFQSSGEWRRNVTEMQDGHFGLPLFARAGAIVPRMVVDDRTMDILGKRTDGSRLDGLVVRVFPSTDATSFTLFEDDGETNAYLGGAVRLTDISQQAAAGTVTVRIDAAQGSYDGAPSSRGVVLELVTEGPGASAVTVDGVALPQHASRELFDAAESGFFNAGRRVLAKAPPASVSTPRTFVITP